MIPFLFLSTTFAAARSPQLNPVPSPVVAITPAKQAARSLPTLNMALRNLQSTLLFGFSHSMAPIIRNQAVKFWSRFFQWLLAHKVPSPATATL